MIPANTKMKHGSNSYYASGCRCNDCRTAHSVYEKGRRRDLRYSNQHRRSSAEPWRALLRELTFPQVQLEDIAEFTGIRVETLREIRGGRTSEINSATRRALTEFVRSLPGDEQ